MSEYEINESQLYNKQSVDGHAAVLKARKEPDPVTTPKELSGPRSEQMEVDTQHFFEIITHHYTQITNLANFRLQIAVRLHHNFREIPKREMFTFTVCHPITKCNQTSLKAYK